MNHYDTIIELLEIEIRNSIIRCRPNFYRYGIRYAIMVIKSIQDRK